MNPFDSSPASEAETILVQEKLHRGIFILPIIAIFALLIPEIIFIVFIQKLIRSFAQIGGGKQQFGFPFALHRLTPAILFQTPASRRSR